MISQFDRKSLQLLRSELDKALVAVSAKYGIGIRVGNATYLDTNATFKLELSVKSSDGTIVSKERADYTRYAELEGLKPEWLDKTFKFRGDTYKIVGFKTKARRMPILASNESGKVFKFDTLAIKNAFGVKTQATVVDFVPRNKVVIGSANPDHDEIVRRLTQLRNDCPEGYYADGEHRMAGLSEKQIYNMHYESFARQIADERSGKKPLFGSMSVPPPPPIK